MKYFLDQSPLLRSVMYRAEHLTMKLNLARSKGFRNLGSLVASLCATECTRHVISPLRARVTANTRHDLHGGGSPWSPSAIYHRAAGLLRYWLHVPCFSSLMALSHRFSLFCGWGRNVFARVTLRVMAKVYFRLCWNRPMPH